MKTTNKFIKLLALFAIIGAFCVGFILIGGTDTKEENYNDCYIDIEIIESMSDACVSVTDCSETYATNTQLSKSDIIQAASGYMVEDYTSGQFYIDGIPVIPKKTTTTQPTTTTTAPAVTGVKNTKKTTVSSTEKSEAIYFFLIDGNVSKSSQDYAMNYWNKIPSHIRSMFFEKGWTLTLTTNKLYTGEDTIGLCSYSTRNLTVLVTNNKYIRNALIHEVGHFYDYSLGRPSNKALFKEIFNEEKGYRPFVNGTSHSYSTQSEYFAEAFEDYIRYPNSLKSRAPRTYEYIRYCVVNGTAPTTTTVTTTTTPIGESSTSTPNSTTKSTTSTVPTDSTSTTVSSTSVPVTESTAVPTTTTTVATTNTTNSVPTTTVPADAVTEPDA